MAIGDAKKNGVLDDCESGLFIRSVLFPTDAPQIYYRAQSLRLKSRSAASAELEFRGVLEKSVKLEGPWTPVP